MKKSPELLLPAGGLERMQTAFDFGADAVYAGSPRYSLRARNNEFAKLDVLQQGISEAHARGKKFYLTVNTLPHNSKLKTFHADMQPLIAMKPDALIMADPGLIMEVRDKYPDMPVLAEHRRRTHHPVARIEHGRNRRNPPRMPRY